MLDPWIIEEIRKREDLDREERPVLEIPLDRPADSEGCPEERDEDDRGVVIVDFRV